MNISINPTYYCNFRCKFCYLTEKQLGDMTLLNIDRLEEMLIVVSSFKKIQHVDLYGGEIGLLSEDYINSLVDLFKKFNINIYKFEYFDVILQKSQQ